MANDAFNQTAYHWPTSQTHTTPSAPAYQSRPSPFVHPAFATRAPQPVTPVAHSTATSLAIDGQHAQYGTPRTCYRCRKPGHSKDKCPHKFDIRWMCREEREMYADEVMATRDAVYEVADKFDNVIEKPVCNMEREESEEDFVRTSK